MAHLPMMGEIDAIEDRASAATERPSTASGPGKAGYAPVGPREASPVPGVRSRFQPGPRSIWKDVPDALWNDWHWQQRERIMRLEQLERVIRVTPDERRATVQTEAQFHMGITPYYAALMDPEDPTCPIRL